MKQKYQTINSNEKLTYQLELINLADGAKNS